MYYRDFIQHGEITFERDESYLSHHGTKGMKWGIRRYQNPDGSLTEDGKKRYRLDVVKKLSKDKHFNELVKQYHEETKRMPNFKTIKQQENWFGSAQHKKVISLNNEIKKEIDKQLSSFDDNIKFDIRTQLYLEYFNNGHGAIPVRW